MNVLLFTGAGTSAELGVPAMHAMAELFIDHLNDVDVTPDIIARVAHVIETGGHDMEHAIDVIDSIERGLLARRQMGETVADAEIQPYRRLREEAEWFVQHSCEQVRVSAALRMWAPLLTGLDGITLTIASTNYDRAIEIAATRLRLPIDDGFEPFDGQERASWVGFKGSVKARLLKLHGSTDWYHGANHDVFKLRHPMPLYGALELVSAPNAILPLHSALILPSREKTVTLPPFPALAAEFRNRADDADVAIFLGTSLRDPHIRDVCVSCAGDRPTFVVSRTGVFPDGLVPTSARVIRQSSGEFLISSLPHCLRSRDIEVLARLADSQATPAPNALAWLIVARTEDAPRQDRCSAIESLADARIGLPREEVAALLESKDSAVRLYALGLVQESPERNYLLALARRVAGEEPDVEFTAEVALLEQMTNGAE